MMNLDKLMLNNNNITINKLNCHKIFFASLVETNKLYDDFVIPKNILCKVALIESSELISIEAEFLQKVNYNLYIEENQFLKYKLKLNNLYEKKKIELNINKEEEERKEKQKVEQMEKVFKSKCFYYNYVSADFSNNTNNNFCEL